VIVLDTNVISELMRASPHKGVAEWVARHRRSTLFTTALSKAEILFGVALLAAGKRREKLRAAASAIFDEDFAGRVISFDTDAASVFAEIASKRRRAGQPIAQIDAQIAAICRLRGASLATRNVNDFQGCDIEIVDPWA
jgi:hypothetical protein